MVAHWDMPEGYYLYRHRFAVSAGEGVTLGAPAIPPGEPKTDEHFGDCEVYFGSAEITVPVIERSASVAARIRFQGCADTGLCYPPQVRAVAHPVRAVVNEVPESAVAVAEEARGSAARVTAAGDSGEPGRPPAQHPAGG